MKLKTLINAMAVAGLVSTSLVAVPAMAQTTAKEATTHTKANNDALYGQLPFLIKPISATPIKALLLRCHRMLLRVKRAMLSGTRSNTLLSKKGKKRRIR